MGPSRLTSDQPLASYFSQCAPVPGSDDDVRYLHIDEDNKCCHNITDIKLLQMEMVYIEFIHRTKSELH